VKIRFFPLTSPRHLCAVCRSDEIKKSINTCPDQFEERGKYFLYEKYQDSLPILQDLIKAELKKTPVNRPFLAEAYVYLGAVQYQLREYQNSIQALNEVLAFNDSEAGSFIPWAHYHLGNCYRDTGEDVRAKQEYDIAYETNNNLIRRMVEKARKKINQ
jgi:tetratricopeptide (TPR) repeat protein